ncbi:MAG: lysylphosphatidylglycerol synthase transmembrane domain-containing protein [bacterium]
MSWKLFWAGLAIGAVFLVATARHTDVHQQMALLRAIPASKAGWFVAGCAFHLAHLAGRSLRWRFLFAPPRPALPRLFSALSIGYLYNNVVPRSGELVRMLVVGKWVPELGFGGIGVTVAVERLLDVLMVMSLALVVFAGSRFDAADVSSTPAIIGAVGIAAVAIAATIAVVVAFPTRVRSLVTRLVARMPDRLRGPLGRFSDGIFGALDGLRSLRGGTGAIVVALCLLDFFFVNTSYRMLSRAFGDAMISVADTAFIMVGSGLGAMLPSGPGNVGTMVFFMAAAAARTSMAPAAAAYAVAIFLTYYLVRTSTGVVCLVVETRRERHRAVPSTTDERNRALSADFPSDSPT